MRIEELLRATRQFSHIAAQTRTEKYTFIHGISFPLEKRPRPSKKNVPFMVPGGEAKICLDCDGRLSQSQPPTHAGFGLDWGIAVICIKF